MSKLDCVVVAVLRIILVLIFLLPKATFAQQTNANSSSRELSPIKAAGPFVTLLLSPNHFLIGADDNNPREILVGSSGGPLQITWLLSQAVTSDGKYVLPATAININSNKDVSLAIEPGKPTPLFVQIATSGVHSGEYTGEIGLYSTNTAASIQFIVRVKDKAALPVLTLLIGILLSFCLSIYRDDGRQHDVLVLQASKIEQTLATDADLSKAASFKDAISDKLDLTRQQIDQRRYTDAAATIADATKVMDNWLVRKSIWLHLFNQISDLEKQAAGNSNPNLPSLIVVAKAAATAAPTASSADQLTTAVSNLATALGSPFGGGAAPAFGTGFRFTPGEVSTAQGRKWAYLITCYSVMIALFFMVGYDELYDAKPVFGANGVVDYFTLFLWGFGVETTTRASLTTVAKNWGITN